MAKYQLGPVTPLVEAVAYLLGPMFGITEIGGYRSEGSVPDSDHPKGKALDFMVPDQATGDALAGFATKHAKKLGIKYIVWNRRSWNPQRGTWEPYTSTNNPHTDHVHISFLDKNDGTPLDGLRDGIGDAFGNIGEGIYDVIDPFGIGKTITNRDFWRRIATGIVGASFIVAGLLFLARRPVTQVVAGVGNVAGDLAGTALQGWAFGLGAGGNLMGKAKVDTRPTSGAPVSATPVTVPQQPRIGPKPPKMLPPNNAPVTSPLPPEIYAPVSPGGTYNVTAVGRVDNPTEYRRPSGKNLLDQAGLGKPIRKKSRKGKGPTISTQLRDT